MEAILKDTKDDNLCTWKTLEVEDMNHVMMNKSPTEILRHTTPKHNLNNKVSHSTMELFTKNNLNKNL